MPRGGVKGDMQADEIARLKGVLQRGVGETEFLRGSRILNRIMGEHSHLEAARNADAVQTDAARAHHAQRLGPQFKAPKPLIRKALLVFVAPVPPHDVPGHGKKQAEGVFGDEMRAEVRDIAHRHAQSSRLLYIDMVIPGRASEDQLQVGESFQHLPGHPPKLIPHAEHLRTRGRPDDLLAGSARTENLEFTAFEPDVRSVLEDEVNECHTHQG